MMTRQSNGTSKSCGTASKQDQYEDLYSPDSKNGNGCCSKGKLLLCEMCLSCANRSASYPLAPVTLAVCMTGIKNGVAYGNKTLRWSRWVHLFVEALLRRCPVP
ncbi:hypothetical protein CY34DRAFT_799705 [Suillus luteus UH-Slu-Lm8-n1]|uniref:Uncharacterized protein n=1 Tax=Suillus luteus UH-Slu-Lm8-n1 TaxID=930992 RepID=A0A0D0AA92_9AGAM|nr:hypothetical protein CY34DRAFT_799705 [Suillus luteus UH-Slu-Lm8-n1]